MAKNALHAFNASHGHGEGLKQEPRHKADAPMVHLIRGAVAARRTVLGRKNNPTDDLDGDLGVAGTQAVRPRKYSSRTARVPGGSPGTVSRMACLLRHI
jgi:hypothetical protein